MVWVEIFATNNVFVNILITHKDNEIQSENELKTG